MSMTQVRPICTTEDGKHWCDETDALISRYRRSTDAHIERIDNRLSQIPTLDAQVEQLSSMEARLIMRIDSSVDKTAERAAEIVQRTYKIKFADWALLRLRDTAALAIVLFALLLWFNHEELASALSVKPAPTIQGP